ncbi:AsmA family protein [Arenibacterium halophilum]|uniref:AsmA family protein n=1 Tax=Arenibacterium halophilum TaxID=2583821 RepID=A0ABY2X7Q2_9RHOB|nr:AsmA family protein [Arenibacterium halophilum]TMV11828.1 AsmA family protein [Arenibacterium halophilum]
MRWIFRMLAALVLAAVVAVGALFFLPGERIARIAADQLAAQTGRSVTIEGPVSLRFWPVVGATTGPVAVGNTSWAGEAPMLRAGTMTVGLSASDLLRGRIRVTELTAHRPELNLARRADGRANWDFNPKPAAAPAIGEGGASSGTGAVTLERLVLTGARLAFADEGRRPVEYSNVDLTLDWPDPNGMADISLAFSPVAERIRAGLRIADFGAFLDGDVSRVTGEIAALGGTVSIVGHASTAGEAKGHVTVKATDTARLLAALGGPAVTIPRGLGKSADVVTEATYTADGRLSLRELSLTLDDNHLRGAADIGFGEPLSVTAQLAGATLDLSGLDATPGAQAAPAQTSPGWSATPIDASALGRINGNIALNLTGLRTGDVTLGAVQAVLAIDRSRAVLDVARAEAFGGTLSGQLVANNRKGLSVGGDLAARDVEMAQLLGDLAGSDRLSGPAQARMQFLGVGASVDAIMRSLSGTGAISMEQGRLRGLDLNALMNDGQSTGGTTVFDSLTAGFTIAGGTLTNDDLLVSLPNYRTTGAGRIGLGARDMDYLLTPTALRARGGQGLAVPVRIKGPWSALRLYPDLEAVLKARAGVERDRLEQKARDKLRERLNIGEEQNVEDAIKDKIEEEAKRGLMKLLGRD